MRHGLHRHCLVHYLPGQCGLDVALRLRLSQLPLNPYTNGLHHRVWLQHLRLNSHHVVRLWLRRLGQQHHMLVVRVVEFRDGLLCIGHNHVFRGQYRSCQCVQSF